MGPHHHIFIRALELSLIFPPLPSNVIGGVASQEHQRGRNAWDRQERSQWMTVAIANLCHPSAGMGKQGGENLEALLGGIFRGPSLTVNVEIDMRRYLRTDDSSPLRVRNGARASRISGRTWGIAH